MKTTQLLFPFFVPSCEYYLTALRLDDLQYMQWTHPFLTLVNSEVLAFIPLVFIMDSPIFKED